ncbi:class I adenylate-forming enzyme family protein [Yoonia sediminilitoris]|uniref:Acyl-CoA synthetase (AMP-forming)/AMP-acid ligase II n=1 Tax=Yoonia sediminilitoris TaxID=1286148 RepID=A0A2T6KR08_9RHOB|nr:class I adenylate-forming enzyme family protein [Yoonia sediminilitoris]PUB18996.1 acyl-CoA synthetase (AMP-forming)/AMP-acid ligase II [Yoonia sediminilitoris]RCW99164.1 acyl-CoA synthetase (AMP-forming)/AMP-acid ligase II [Yoonia sediminilitoris]
MKITHIHDLVARQAVQSPAALSIIDFDGRTYSYAVHQAAIEQAGVILRDHGVQQGDRVLLVAENCIVVTAFIFAASQTGAICVPVNARMTQAELDRVLDHATPRLVVYTTQASSEAATHAKRAVAATRMTDFGEFALITHSASNPVDDDETAVILYTTGTTGTPKGVMLTHANLIFAGKTSANLRQMTPEDRLYGVLPLNHVFGLASMLMAASYCGASVQLATRFQPARVFAALSDGVTIFPGVPQMHALLMQYTHEQGLERLENSKLHYVSSGAAPLDPAWKRKAEAFYGIALQNGYGMTESTAGICGTRNPKGLADTSVGPALPGIKIKLDLNVGAQGDDMTGEILTHGPHVMKGYFRNMVETAKVIDEDGWLRTGDLGAIDAQGQLHVVGRCKELIIRSGFNVYPPEVEAALNDDPDVIQSAVIGRAVEGSNEEILAFVQCADPAAIDLVRLEALAASRLASYKRPSRIIPVTALPAAATGKILKHKLLSTFATLLAETHPKD